MALIHSSSIVNEIKRLFWDIFTIPGVPMDTNLHSPQYIMTDLIIIHRTKIPYNKWIRYVGRVIAHDSIVLISQSFTDSIIRCFINVICKPLMTTIIFSDHTTITTVFMTKVQLIQKYIDTLCLLFQNGSDDNKGLSISIIIHILKKTKGNRSVINEFQQCKNPIECVSRMKFNDGTNKYPSYKYN